MNDKNSWPFISTPEEQQRLQEFMEFCDSTKTLPDRDDEWYESEEGDNND